MKKRFRSTLGVNLTVIVTVELVGIILLLTALFVYNAPYKK